MKPFPVSTPPAWLADIFPGLNDPIDTTEYDYEERVAIMIGGGFPETWVRGGLANLQGRPWQDRILLFLDRYSLALASNGWELGDLFPPNEIIAPQPQIHGIGWPLIDALDAGGRVVGIDAFEIIYVDGKGRRSTGIA